MKLRLGHPPVLYEVDWLSLKLVSENAQQLRAHGVYERALLGAFIHTAHATWNLEDLKALFATADRARLRDAGDALPGPGPFTVYRGVAGDDRERRVRGLSWTGSVEQARWFAREHARRLAEWMTLPDPAVYRVTIDERDVLAYSNKEEEDEFVVEVPATAGPERVVE